MPLVMPLIWSLWSTTPYNQLLCLGQRETNQETNENYRSYFGLDLVSLQTCRAMFESSKTAALPLINLNLTDKWMNI